MLVRSGDELTSTPDRIGDTWTAEAAAESPGRAIPLALATKILDLIVGMTWRVAERPRLATVDDRDLPAGSVRFCCPKCEQAWIAPPSLSRTFVFRCSCGERMIVRAEPLSVTNAK
jgi:hypothetical protein